MDLEKYQKIDTGRKNIDYFFLNDDQKIKLLENFTVKQELISDDEFTSVFLLDNGWVISVIGSLQEKKGFGLYLNLSLEDYQKGESAEAKDDEDVVNEIKTLKDSQRVEECFEYDGSLFFVNKNFIYYKGYEKDVKLKKLIFEKYKDDIIEYSIWFELLVANKQIFNNFENAKKDISVLLDINLNLLDYSLESIDSIDYSLREVDRNKINILKFFLPMYVYILKCIIVNSEGQKLKMSFKKIDELGLLIPQVFYYGTLVKVEHCILLFLEEFKKYGENDHLGSSIEKFFPYLRR